MIRRYTRKVYSSYPGLRPHAGGAGIGYLTQAKCYFASKNSARINGKNVNLSKTKNFGKLNDTAPVVVVGAGVAGSAAALTLAQAGIPVSVYTLSSNVKDCASLWAQGGIIYKGALDSPAKLGADVHAAGAGICDEKAVNYLGNMGPKAVEDLLLDLCGTKFATNPNGSLKLTLEAAHSLPRIIFTGDFTGRTITESMQKAMLNHDLISWEPRQVTDLIVKDGRCVGLATLDENDNALRVPASQVVLATGGIGEIYARTSNPASAKGEGIALAKRAGAELGNMEYVQFHPTSFMPEGERAFLLTEAMRGEGAILRNEAGEAFAKNYDPRGELAPRDVVTRLMWSEMKRTEQPHVYLDITHKDSNWLENRFPSIHKHVNRFGYHIGEHRIPVAPSAHYHCGGVMVDLQGRTTVPGLYAAGEVACTGLHGANRLASTSLLEGLVWGRSLGDAIIAEGLNPIIDNFDDTCGELGNACSSDEPMPSTQPICDDLGESPYKSHNGPGERKDIPQEYVDDLWNRLRQTMWQYVGVVRTDDGLDLGIDLMKDIEKEAEMLYKRKNSRAIASLWNATETGLLVAKAAGANPDSLGAHYRVAAEDPPRMYSEDEFDEYTGSEDENMKNEPKISVPSSAFMQMKSQQVSNAQRPSL